MTGTDRLRAIGWTILAIGFGAAVVRYWTLARDELLVNDTTALGYKRSVEHGVGVMMGPSGAVLTDLSNLLASPIGQAAIIVVCAVLCAGCLFRVAWVRDFDARGGEEPRPLG